MIRNEFGLTFGTAYGCGYGPVDPTMAGIAPLLRIEDIAMRIASYVLWHGPQYWTPSEHFVHAGCGMSCGCCRAANFEGFGSCEVCDQAFTMLPVSSDIERITRRYASKMVHCECGGCRLEWLRAGWICPVWWDTPD